MSLKNCLLLSLFLFFTSLAINAGSLVTGIFNDNTNASAMFFESDEPCPFDTFEVFGNEEERLLHFLSAFFMAPEAISIPGPYMCNLKNCLIPDSDPGFSRYLFSFHNLSPPV